MPTPIVTRLSHSITPYNQLTPTTPRLRSNMLRPLPRLALHPTRRLAHHKPHVPRPYLRTSVYTLRDPGGQLLLPERPVFAEGVRGRGGGEEGAGEAGRVDQGVGGKG